MIRISPNILICLLFYSLPVVTENVMSVPWKVQNFKANDEIVFRIKNGIPATVGEIPYQISFKVKSIFSNYASFCGGAMLSANKILSAGHCFTHMGNSCDRVCKKVKTKNILNMYAVAGTIHNKGAYKADSAGTEQWRKLRLVLVPPGYYYMTNDISLVFVHGKFNFNARVSTLPAATMPKDYGSILCRMSGYGMISDTVSSDRLRYADLRLLPQSECSKIHGRDMNNYICTSSYPSDTGKGDSGGPLVCKNTGDPSDKGQGVIVGVLSGARRSGVGKDTYFTRVSSYRNFHRRNDANLFMPLNCILWLSLIISL